MSDKMVKLGFYSKQIIADYFFHLNFFIRKSDCLKIFFNKREIIIKNNKL